MGVIARLRSAFWKNLPASPLPFTVHEIGEPDAAVDDLFRTCFRAAAPRFPHHFVARWRRDGSVAGYIHFTRHEAGVYLVGGLCVDVAVYKLMSKEERALMRAQGSLSRWLLAQSTALLPDKHAVFGYTGNVMSLRDGRAVGYETTHHKHLIVQWHATPEPERTAVVERIAALGPF
jgi:hypothetical protein